MLDSLPSMLLECVEDGFASFLKKEYVKNKDNHNIDLMKKELNDYLFEFSNDNDGTIVTTGDLYISFENQKVILKILEYLFIPNSDFIRQKPEEKIKSESTFKNDISTSIVNRISEKLENRILSAIDREIIENLINGLFDLAYNLFNQYFPDRCDDYFRKQEFARSYEADNEILTRLGKSEVENIEIIKETMSYKSFSVVLSEDMIYNKLIEFTFYNIKKHKHTVNVFIEIEKINNNIIPKLTFNQLNINTNSKEDDIEKDYSLEELVRVDKSPMIIVGAGGMGKTVSLIHLADIFKNDDEYIPFFYRLNSLNRKEVTAENLIDKLLEEKYSYKEIITFKEIIKDGTANRCVLMLLDGLNEVSDKIYDDVERGLHQIYINYHNVKIIITSRKDLSSGRFEYYKKCYLKLLDDEVVKQHLLENAQNNNTLIYKIEKWYEQCCSQNKEILIEPRNLDVLRNPMMLTIFIKTNFSSHDLRLSFPRNSGEILIHLYSWLFLKSGDKLEQRDGDCFIMRNEVIDTIDEVAVALLTPFIAYKMVMNNEFTIEQEMFEEILDEFCAYYSTLNTGISINYDIAYESLKRADILKLWNDEAEVYEFGHQHFRDFFAAKHYLNKIQDAIKTQDKEKAQMILTESFGFNIPLEVLCFLGFIAEENKKTPVLKNGVWKQQNKSSKSHIEKALDIMRGVRDRHNNSKIAFAVKNLISVSIASRNESGGGAGSFLQGDLSGMDLSDLDLTKTHFNEIICSRVQGTTGNVHLRANFSSSQIIPETFMPSGHGASIDKMLILYDKCKEYDKVITFTGDAIILHNLRENTHKRLGTGTAGRIHFACFFGNKYILTANDFGEGFKLWEILEGDDIRPCPDFKLTIDSKICSLIGIDKGFVVGTEDGKLIVFEYINKPSDICKSILKKEFGSNDCVVKKIENNDALFYFISSFKLYKYNAANCDTKPLYDLIECCNEAVNNLKDNGLDLPLSKFYIKEFEVFNFIEPKSPPYRFKYIVFVLSYTEFESTVDDLLIIYDTCSKKIIPIYNYYENIYCEMRKKGKEPVLYTYISKIKPIDECFLVCTNKGYCLEFKLEANSVKFEKKYETSNSEIMINWQAEYVHYQKSIAIATISNNRTFKLFDKNAWVLKDYEGFYSGIRTFRMIKGSDGLFIAAHYNKKISIWDKELRCLCSFKVHNDWVWAADANSDLGVAVSCSQEHDKNIKEWDIKTGAEIKLNGIRFHNAKVETICYSPDGKCILSGGHDGKVILHFLSDRPVNNMHNATSAIIYDANKNLNDTTEIKKIAAAVFADDNTVIIAEKANINTRLIEYNILNSETIEYIDENREGQYYWSVEVLGDEYIITSGGSYLTRANDPVTHDGSYRASTVLWSRKTHKPVTYFGDNIYDTFSTVSPKINGKNYVVTITSFGMVYIYDFPVNSELRLAQFYQIDLKTRPFYIEFYEEKKDTEVYFYITCLNGELYRFNINRILENEDIFQDNIKDAKDNGRLISASNMSGFLAHGCNFSDISDKTLHDYFTTYRCQI